MTEKFNNPNITINKVYTKIGDDGTTFLIGGKKVDKSSNRVCAFGEIDELNVYLGLCSSNNDIRKINIKDKLTVIQNDLFNLGNMLATPNDYNSDASPRITNCSIDFLEKNIDYYNKDLKPLKSFVLPGGSKLSIDFHLARVVCRRCERLVVRIQKTDDIDSIIIQYLNRLSDLLFVLSRYSNFILNENELFWNPNYGEE
jgi:cob(I)alamin adenosyltransferase